MEEKELIKITPPELKEYDPQPFWDQVMFLYDRKFSPEMIAFHLNYQDVDTIKDIINYNKNLRNASK